MAQAEPGSRDLAEARCVAREELRAVLVAVRAAGAECRVRRRHQRAFDVAGADRVEGLALEAGAKALAQRADAERMGDPAGLQLAVQRQLQRVGAPAFVLAAEVVQVERAVGAEAVEVVFRTAPEGECDAVVRLQTLGREMRCPSPLLAQPLRKAQRGIVAVEHHRQRPRLVVEVDARVDAPRIRHRIAQHAEARNARLAAVARLDFGFKQRVGCDAPVAGQREQRATTAGVAHTRIEPFGRRIHAQAEDLPLAESLAQVDRTEQRTVLLPGEARFAQRLGQRPLDDVVHQAAGGAHAGLQAARALQQLELLLVVERDACLGVDRQAVATVVRLVVDDVAAHREEVPVAFGVVGVARRRVDTHDVGQALHAEVAHLLAADDARR